MKSFLNNKVLLLVGSFCILVAAGLLVKFYYYEGKRVSFFRTKKHFSVETKGVKKVVLNNGMTVLVYPNSSVPKVLVQIAYDIGSYVEKEGERGMAHLIEHMIFKGTQKLSESDIDEIARKFGASYNAFTSMDVTSYYFETNKNNWQPFVEILADCMQNARFDEQHLASELKAVIQELKMYKDDYWSMMFEKIDSLLYPANHPYHYSIIGYKDDLMNLSAEKLKKFYNKYYHPDRATLFIVGDIDPKDAIDCAKKCFEPIELKKKTEVRKFPQIYRELIKHHTTFYEDIQAEQLGFYWQISGLKHKDELAASAAAILLGRGEGSRLHRVLVDEKKIALSVGVYDQKFMESGVFLILIEPIPEKRKECKIAIQEELSKAVEKGFEDKEIEHMVRSEGKRFFQKLQSFKGFTYEWLISFFSSKDEYAVFDRVNKFVDIESQLVQDFIKKYLDPVFINQIEVLPIPDSKREIGIQIKKESDKLDRLILEKHKRTTAVEPPLYSKSVNNPRSVEFIFPKPDRVLALDNGLKVLLRKNPRLPIMHLSYKFKESHYFASALEGVLVDLMMSMLIEESIGYSKTDNVDFFEFQGVDYYFGAGGGSLSLLSSDYEKVFNRFIHVLDKPSFSLNALRKVKNILIDTLIRSKDSPADMGIRALKSGVYKNHPFSWTFDEAIDLVEKSKTVDLIKCHKKYVTPENMILTIVGDFDLDEMEKTVTSIFGKKSEGPEVVIEHPKASFNPKVEVNIKMLRDQVVLLFGQPSLIDIYHDDLIPLKLLNFIAFHSLGSRIFQLREESGLFYTAFGAWATNSGKDKGFDYMGAILNPDKVPYAEKKIKELIDSIGKNGVKQHELDSAKQLYLKSLIDAVSSNAAVASLLGTLESFQLGFDYYDRVFKKIQTITLDEVNAVCKKYFKTDDMMRVCVGRMNK
jgi:zinc protease